MSLRVASLLSTTSVPGADVVGSLRQQLGGAPPALVVLFASPEHDLAELLAGATAAAPGATVIGASSAGEFSERGSAHGAVSALAVAGDVVAHGGLGLGLRASPEEAVGRALASVPRAAEGYAYRTGIVLFDALAGHGEETALLTAMHLDSTVPLVGGAAGDDLRMERTRVGLGAETASDAVALVVLSTHAPIGIGVCHGHTPLSGPLTVTRADGARVYTLEGRPAWEVWSEQTRHAAAAHGLDPARLEGDEVGAYLLRYEGGVAAGQSFKIRAPLRRFDDGSLLFASEVPEGTRLRITESDAGRQVTSAREAARLARARLGGARPAGALVFDCVCRGLILGSQVDEAVAAMSEELDHAPLAGFATYGEIALDTSDLSGFHNTTSVVMALGAESSA